MCCHTVSMTIDRMIFTRLAPQTLSSIKRQSLCEEIESGCSSPLVKSKKVTEDNRQM